MIISSGSFLFRPEVELERPVIPRVDECPHNGRNGRQTVANRSRSDMAMATIRQSHDMDVPDKVGNSREEIRFAAQFGKIENQTEIWSVGRGDCVERFVEIPYDGPIARRRSRKRMECEPDVAFCRMIANQPKRIDHQSPGVLKNVMTDSAADGRNRPSTDGCRQPHRFRGVENSVNLSRTVAARESSDPGQARNVQARRLNEIDRNLLVDFFDFGAIKPDAADSCLRVIKKIVGERPAIGRHLADRQRPQWRWRPRRHVLR